MTMHEVREALHAIADVHAIPELHTLAEETLRRRHGPRPGRVSVRMTPALRRRIRAFARRCPTLTQSQIATALNVNAGRVSEELWGERT